jgi:hypothetical protein
VNDLLVIDKAFGESINDYNVFPLLPGYEYQPDWRLNFDKHEVYNREIIKSKYRLAALFSEKIYSPNLGYKKVACESLFLNFGGAITFLISDRLLRINKFVASVGVENILLPKVNYNHDPSISYNNFFYNFIEQDPQFNQWIINQLLPDLNKIDVLVESSDKKLFIIEKYHAKIGILGLLKRFINKNILCHDIPFALRLNNIKKTTKSVVSRIWRKQAAKYAYKKGRILADTPFQSVTSQFSVSDFFWPFGPLSFISDEIITKESTKDNNIKREMFASLEDEVADIFRTMLINCGDGLMIPESSLHNISTTISKLLPLSTTEFAKANCVQILDEFKEFSNKTYFSTGGYQGDKSALCMFACNELRINILATQHSAWGGYLANGPLVSELLIAGCDDYITFGWNKKADDGTSSWRNKVITMPSPVISELFKNRAKRKVGVCLNQKRHVLLCLGFLYRFPSIYNSFLRWDTVNEWGEIINNIVKHLSDAGIKITFVMYNDYVASTLQDFMHKWLKTGGANIAEHTEHSNDVRQILSSSDFELKYDAVIWDLPTGGFTESIANDHVTFSLWNSKIIKSLPEGDPYIKSLIKSGVFFENGNAIVNSLCQLYKNKEWYHSEEVQSSINAFMNKFVTHSSDWVNDWKKLFDHQSGMSPIIIRDEKR